MIPHTITLATVVGDLVEILHASISMQSVGGRIYFEVDRRPVFDCEIRELPADIDGLHTWLHYQLTSRMPKAPVSAFDHINFYAGPWNDAAPGQGYDGPGWYCWDETQANASGPFPDILEARRALDDYASRL